MLPVSIPVSRETRAVHALITARLMGVGEAGGAGNIARMGITSHASEPGQLVGDREQPHARVEQQHDRVEEGLSVLGDLWLEQDSQGRGLSAGARAPAAAEAGTGPDGDTSSEPHVASMQCAPAALELTAPSVPLPSAVVAALLPCMAQGALQLWPQVGACVYV